MIFRQLVEINLIDQEGRNAVPPFFGSLRKISGLNPRVPWICRSRSLPGVFPGLTVSGVRAEEGYTIFVRIICLGLCWRGNPTSRTRVAVQKKLRRHGGKDCMWVAMGCARRSHRAQRICDTHCYPRQPSPCAADSKNEYT